MPFFETAAFRASAESYSLSVSSRCRHLSEPGVQCIGHCRGVTFLSMLFFRKAVCQPACKCGSENLHVEGFLVSAVAYYATERQNDL